jgi:hypothetical protein
MLGPTHWSWRPDVEAIAYTALSHFHGITANTYVGHPWEGWDGRSIDFGVREDGAIPSTARLLDSYGATSTISQEGPLFATRS